MASRRYENFDLLHRGRGRRHLSLPRRGEPGRCRRERDVRDAVRRDRAGEPAPQARPRPLPDAPRDRRPAAQGVDRARRSALRGGLRRGGPPRLDAQPGRHPRRRRRAAAAAAAHRRAGDRRAAVGAALRPAYELVPRAVRAHAARPLPRGAAPPTAADRRRAAADPRRPLLADRPARARRRGRVAADAGHARHPRGVRSRPAGPAAVTDDDRARRVVALARGARPARHRARGLRRGPAGGRPLLLRRVRPQRRRPAGGPRPVPARPRPAAAGVPQRLPVRPARRRGPVQRHGPAPRPAGLHRGRRDAVPHQRRRRHRVHR